MTSSAKSSSLASSRRQAAVLLLIASSAVAACSLLAPSDHHYLGDPARSPSEAGAGGDRDPVRGEGGAAGDVPAGGDSAGGDSAGGDSAGGNAGVGGDLSGGGGNAAGGGGTTGSGAGAGSSGEGGKGPLSCSGDLADCNQKSADGCEVDLSSSSANCGGCGKAFACAADEVCEHRKCISVSGCSDGKREAFLKVNSFPRIAGCTAQWPRSSLRAPKTGAACGFETHVCEVPADACGLGWHVCASKPYGPAEVSSQATQAECAAQVGAFVAAVGDQNCEPCSEAGDGAACCGDLCVQQEGSCIYPGKTAWFGVYNNYKNVCGAIESDLDGRGVLCCRAP